MIQHSSGRGADCEPSDFGREARHMIGLLRNLRYMIGCRKIRNIGSQSKSFSHQSHRSAGRAPIENRRILAREAHSMIGWLKNLRSMIGCRKIRNIGEPIKNDTTQLWSRLRLRTVRFWPRGASYDWLVEKIYDL